MEPTPDLRDALLSRGLAPGALHALVLTPAMLDRFRGTTRLAAALRGLRGLLRQGGTFVLFITRRNGLTRPLIGRWWQSNLYDVDELERAFREAGFASVAFGRFPPSFRYLSLWGHIVEARQ